MPKVKKFTADAVKRCKLPEGKGQVDYFENLSPGRSLILTLNKSGRCTWSALFYERGKPRRKKLGEYPDIGCREARDAAIKLDAGKAIAAAKAGTLDAVADTYIARHVQDEDAHLRSESEITRLLKVHVRPRWGRKRFADIRRSDVVELQEEIKDEHGAGVADSVLAVVRALMNWHQKRDDHYTSPIVRGMRLRKAVKRERWLTDDEVRALWEACEDASTFGAICRMLLLTGQRRTKVASMGWRDIDLETGEWHIPREEREKGTPPAITLPEAALDVVRAQPRIADNPHIFAGRGGVAFNAWSDSKEALDKKLNFEKPWRLHDLRRTARKLMTRAEVNTEIAELALGHTIKGIQGVYDDPIEYRPRIDQALRMVEVEVGKILEPGAKVVKFPGHQS